MTIRPKTTVRRRISINAIPLLNASTILMALATTATTFGGSLIPAQIVTPRASVSSEAYRTQTPVVARGGQVRRALAKTTGSEPARLVQASAARPIRSSAHITPVDHRTVTPTGARQDNRQSIRSELSRLYDQEGQQMPAMVTPAYRPQTQSGAGPAITPNANPPSGQTAKKSTSRGLLAGLFDFGRKKNTRRYSSEVPTRPPVEPQPFRPQTYRQQPRPITAVRPQPQFQPQPQPKPQPQLQLKPRTQSPAAQKQATAKSSQSANVFTLQKGAGSASPRNFAEPADGFFPEDSQRLPTIGSQNQSEPLVVEEDLDAFFPDRVATEPAKAPVAEVAPNNMKSRMNELFSSRSQASVETDSPAIDSENPFHTPELVDPAMEEIEPPAVPAAVSEVMPTNVAPLAPEADLPEPAPFFAAGERAIDPQEDMDIAALTGQTFDPSGADSEQTAGTIEDSYNAGSRMQQIAAREGTGLKGFCPVALRDERSLKDGRAGIVAFYQQKAYYFSSASAKETFEAAPQNYTPAAEGKDVTMKTLTGEVIEGSLDHCVWYKDRLYLFHSAENLATFMAAPGAMAVTN